MATLTDAYAAGLFDGEGCILGRVQHPKRGGIGIILVSVGMAYLPTLEEFQERFNGHIHKSWDRRKPKKAMLNRTKTMWCWTLTVAEDVLSFLTAVRPYLREKASQADIAMEYLRERLQYPKYGRMSEEVRKHSLQAHLDLQDEKWFSFDRDDFEIERQKEISYHGVTMPIRSWSEKVGIPYGALNLRLRRGWSTERILTTPVRMYKKEVPGCMVRAP